MFWFVDMVIWCLYLSSSDVPPLLSSPRMMTQAYTAT